MDNQKITPEQAAPILGISPNNIRHSMRNGTLPIGNVRPANTKTRGHRQSYRYDIYKKLVLQYVGLAEWPEDKEEKEKCVDLSLE